MKTRLFLFCAIHWFSSTVLADVQENLPDLARAIQGGKLIHKVDPELMVGFRYEYEADLDFDELKKKLVEFLGDGWKEEEVDPNVTIRVKQAMKKTRGIDIIGSSTFVNPAFPEHYIYLMMKKEKFEKKQWYIVDLCGTWNKKAEQAAPRNR